MDGFTVQIEQKPYLVKPASDKMRTFYTVVIDGCDVKFIPSEEGELTSPLIQAGRVFDINILEGIAQQIESRYM